MRFFAGLIVVLVILTAIVGPQALFVVDETQLAIVTRFGEPIRDMKAPGLYLKTPFIEQVIYLDKRLLVFDAPPDSLLTKDKKNLIIDVYARGRITDPRRFVEAVATEREGRNRAIEIVSSELRREVALDDQSEIIKTSREDVMNRIRDAVKPKLAPLGIDILDVRIKRADFPSQIATSVYERMKAERTRIADRERAEGARTDAEVRANVDKQATIILSSAQKDADIIRGCGEAEATRIFASALEQDPEFYTFQRSLEVYRPSLQNTTMYGAAGDFGQMFEDIRRSFASAARAPEVPDSGTAPTPGDGELKTVCTELDAQFAARRLLTSDLGISGAALLLTGTEELDWPDAGLGCREEGKEYAQGIVPGYRFTFEHEGSTFLFHTNADGSAVVNCTPKESSEG